MLNENENVLGTMNGEAEVNLNATDNEEVVMATGNYGTDFSPAYVEKSEPAIDNRIIETIGKDDLTPNEQLHIIVVNDEVAAMIESDIEIIPFPEMNSEFTHYENIAKSAKQKANEFIIQYKNDNKQRISNGETLVIKTFRAFGKVHRPTAQIKIIG